MALWLRGSPRTASLDAHAGRSTGTAPSVLSTPAVPRPRHHRVRAARVPSMITVWPGAAPSSVRGVSVFLG